MSRGVFLLILPEEVYVLIQLLEVVETLQGFVFLSPFHLFAVNVVYVKVIYVILDVCTQEPVLVRRNAHDAFVS